MFSVSRSPAVFHSAIAHVTRIVAQADWDQRPTFCYRLRAALREALSQVERCDDLDQRARAVIRAAEQFANALRPNFTPSAVDLIARIEELESAGARLIASQTQRRPQAA